MAHMAASEKDMEKGIDRMPVNDVAGGNVGDIEKVDGADTNFALKKGLKGRHMQMIAIGGSIGTGLFVGSGGALQSGGPASLVICFIIIGVMLLFTVSALAEIAVVYPVNGAFFTHTVKLVDPAWGFAMGWNYAMSWLVVLPLELTAAGITISYWNDTINVGVWITVFLVAVTAVNFFGVKGYGEVEFVIGVVKVVAIIGFIILGIIINCGGVPTQTTGYIGGEYWSGGDTPAFRNGFKGFCSVFVTAAFAFAGTELCGLAAAESDNPTKAVPKASKQVFFRIAFFYVVALTIIGLIVPANSPKLLGASGGNTKASPFVIAIEDAGIYALPSIFNAVITLSVLSVANSSTYGSTRTVQALAMKGMAPKIFAKVDKRGRPIWSLIVALLFGALAYINCADVGDTVFSWLLALSGLSTLFTWGSICINHMRFRFAWKASGHTLDELPWASPYGIWGSAIGLLINCIALIAQFYVALFDVDGDPPAADAFFQAYLAAPIVILFYVGYKIYEYITLGRIQLYNSIADMNLDEGRRSVTEEQMEAKFASDNALPKWRGVFNRFC